MERQSNGRQRNWQMVKAIGRQFIPNLGTLLLIGLLLWSQQAGAFPSAQGQTQAIVTTALPNWFNYQGHADDRAGNPVNGNMDMVFALYGELSGGTALWSESHTGGNAVPVQNGEFTVRLGSLTPITGDIWAHDLLFLGIRVGTDSEMMPREELGIVPRAAQAEIALGVALGAVKSRNLDLDYGSTCLSDNVTLNLPGGASVLVPGMVLNLNLEQPSTVLVWMDGLARFDQPSNGDCSVTMIVDEDPLRGRTNSYGYFDNVWFNLDGLRIVGLDSGAHKIELYAQSQQAGSMLVHGPGSGYGTCINYLVLGGQ